MSSPDLGQPNMKDVSPAHPQVSVILPMRNAALTLEECLRSIAGQSLGSYEVVVVNDGSSDESSEITRAWMRHDPRLRLVQSDSVGLVGALNTGLGLAGAPLIARMDADDVMFPDRLARQADFLARHPAVDVVGARVRPFPADKVGKGMQEYLCWQNGCVSSSDLKEEIFIESPLTHPSVMYRRKVVLDAGGYRHGDFPEDYELWLRLNALGSRFAKLPETLLDWRQAPSSLSRTDSRYARDAFDRIRAGYLYRHLRGMGQRPIVFWGAGRRTRARCRHLQILGVTPAAWIDIDPRKIGQTIAGVAVHAPGWLETPGAERPFVLVYVASHGARELIAGNLSGFGFRRGRDYLMVG